MNDSSMKENNTPRLTIIPVIILFSLPTLFIIWFFVSMATVSTTSLERPVKTQQALVMPEFRPLKPFSLTNHKGEPFNNQSLLGQWTFLSFGYTFCPDICPTTMTLFAQMHNRIQAQNGVEPYQITFVSVDPERDSLERLSKYVTYFDPSFVAATGPEEALQALTKPLGILYKRVETEDSAMDYVIDHSASIILVDPQGRFHAYFSPPHDAQKMASDFITLSHRTDSRG
jgi:protein SCO1/2